MKGFTSISIVSEYDISDVISAQDFFCLPHLGESLQRSLGIDELWVETQRRLALLESFPG